MKIKKLIRLPCKYVPPCTKCGSTKTGFIIHNNMNRTVAIPTILAFHLSLGEYVEIASYSSRTDYYNNRCKCFDCGIQWSQHIETRWVTLDELKEIKKEKLISSEMRDYLLGFNDEYKKKLKEQKKQLKKEKRIKKKRERERKLWL